MSIKMSKPLLMIGGRVDGDLMGVPEGHDGPFTVPLPIEHTATMDFGFDEPKPPLYEVYVIHYIHGVELLAIDSMTSTDVMHTLMNSYRKR